MAYTLGFSPCPNDTFIFDALVNKKIDTEGLEFETVLEDVETLNQWALRGKLDITKLSFPAFFQSLDKYVLLNSGSALGKGVGPLLISKSQMNPDSYRDQIPNSPVFQEQVSKSSIAIPGINTTANLLLGFAFPEATNKVPMLFSEIEDAVCMETTRLGVIIHENRFTYGQKGLHKVLDLGEYWEEKMHAPIPLGGIAVKRNVDRLTSLKVDGLIRKSLEYAFVHYPFITDYVKQHSQAMSEEVMRQHIDLYVNNFSIDLGDDGKNAILALSKCFYDIHEEKKSPGNFSLFL
jgi:1,4-dihydroxy-6-naphthoate synthase